jgi:hypothetical protein
LNPAERPWEDLKDRLAFNLFESLAALKAKAESLLAELHPAGARLAGRIRILGRGRPMPTMDNDFSVTGIKH